MLLYRFSPLLGFGEQGVEIGLASFGIGIKCHDQGVEGTYRHSFGIELRLKFARRVEPVPVCIPGTGEGLDKQSCLFPGRVLFDG